MFVRNFTFIILSMWFKLQGCKFSDFSLISDIVHINSAVGGGGGDQTSYKVFS